VTKSSAQPSQRSAKSELRIVLAKTAGMYSRAFEIGGSGTVYLTELRAWLRERYKRECARDKGRVAVRIPGESRP
jgi:hypothetical protein